jgi:hypothetical protein
MAPVRHRGAPQGDSYVVGLDCGRRFAYDAKQWRIGPAFGKIRQKRTALRELEG